MTKLEILFYLEKNGGSLEFTDLLNKDSAVPDNGLRDKGLIVHLINEGYLSGTPKAYERVRLTPAAYAYLDQQRSTKLYKRLNREHRREQKKAKDKNPNQSKRKINLFFKIIAAVLGAVASAVTIIEFFVG